MYEYEYVQLLAALSLNSDLRRTRGTGKTHQKRCKLSSSRDATKVVYGTLSAVCRVTAGADARDCWFRLRVRVSGIGMMPQQQFGLVRFLQALCHLCCIAHKKNSFWPIVQLGKCLEAPLLPFFSSPIFRFSALAQNFSIDPIFCKADMGCLVHSRDVCKAAAVSVPCFQSDLVAEV